GIALGFGVFAGVELSAVALGLNDHLAQSTLNLVNTADYESAIVVWFIYAGKKSSTSVTTVTLLTSQRWERSLSDLRQTAVSDSLIPMFEGMVDRAFSRTGGNHMLEMKATPTALSKDVYTAVSHIRLASKPYARNIASTPDCEAFVAQVHSIVSLVSLFNLNLRILILSRFLACPLAC